MDDVLKWMAFAMQVFPLVLKGIVLAEDTVGSGNGPQKKALVLAPMMAVAPPGADIGFGYNLVSKMIDGLVGPLTNSGKLLPHKPASALAR